MAEPNSSERRARGEPGAGPGSSPAAGSGSWPDGRDRLEGRLQRTFERGLTLAQLTVLLPVVVLALSGVGAFVYACVYAVDSVRDIVHEPFHPQNLRLFLTEIDLFLIGATLIIAAFGLYELFIARIEPGPRGRRVPAWLEMNDLNDLKARVVSMIILVVAVTFADILLEFQRGPDILYLGGGVALVIAALTAYLRYASNGAG
jgi:uncharacterized membrane protein YqhA